MLTSVHLTDHTASMGDDNAVDRWQGYPAQRSRLVALAEEVPGVLFVTGDMHYGAIQRVSPAGAVGDGLWEIAAGPAGSELFVIDEIAELAGGYPPQYAQVVEDWNWARMVLDPGTRTIAVQLIDDAGGIAAEQTLTFPG